MAAKSPSRFSIPVWRKRSGTTSPTLNCWRRSCASSIAASGMKVDLRAVAREASARIAEEVDYRHEAAMITAFSELYRGHPFIRVPGGRPRGSGDRVLTMSYLDGMDWAAAQHADQDLKNTWAEVISRFMQWQLPAREPGACRPSSRQLPLRRRWHRRFPRLRLRARSFPNGSAGDGSALTARRHRGPQTTTTAT